MYTCRASSLSLSSPMGWRQTVWSTAAAAAAAAKLIMASYRPSDWFLRRRDGSDDSDSSHERDRCPLWPCRFYTYPVDRRRRQYALRHPLLCNSSSVRRPADWVKNDLLKIPLPPRKSPQRLRTFNQNFARLFGVCIYAEWRRPNFIQLSPTLTKLCHIKSDRTFLGLLEKAVAKNRVFSAMAWPISMKIDTVMYA